MDLLTKESPSLSTGARCLLSGACDERFGLISRLVEVPYHHSDPAVFAYAAVMPNTQVILGNQANERNGGAGLDESSAVLAAIGESLERYSPAYAPGGLRVASFSELDGEAVPPGQWILYSSDQYRQVESRYVPFDEATPVAWTPAQTLIGGNRDEVLVPAQFTYLPHLRRQGEEIVAPSISTGLSFHTSPHRAKLLGLYECVERDAFSAYWLTQTEADYIRLDDVSPDSIVGEAYARVFGRCKIRRAVCYSLRTDLDLATAFTVVVLATELGDMLCVGTATRTTFTDAVVKTIVEAAQAPPFVRYLFHKEPNWSPGESFENVRTFDYHARLYQFKPALVDEVPLLNPRHGPRPELPRRSRDWRY